MVLKVRDMERLELSKRETLARRAIKHPGDTVQRIVDDLAEVGVHIDLVIARKELREMNINKYNNRKNIKNQRCRHGRVGEADISDLLAM
jgi:hypothetical protein